MANFNIATTEQRSGKNGERNEYTERHRIVCWGRLAEIANILVEKAGRSTSRSNPDPAMEDRDGNSATPPDHRAEHADARPPRDRGETPVPSGGVYERVVSDTGRAQVWAGAVGAALPTTTSRSSPEGCAPSAGLPARSGRVRLTISRSDGSFVRLTRPRALGAVDAAPLAQLAEQVTLNHWVRGSIPWRRTTSPDRPPGR